LPARVNKDIGIMEFERRKKIHTRLDIAPLIDVVFLLLIFFMLSSHFVTHPGIKITLPTAVSAPLHSEENIIIHVAGDNSIFLNGKEVSLSALPEELKPKIEQAGEKSVIIKADQKINLGLAVKIMDIAREADAQALVISTKTENDHADQ